jgi:hypothetical protein
MLTAPRGTVCEKRSSADHAFAARKLPPKSAQEQQGRKNSHNGVSAAWYREWSSTTDRLRRTDTRATHRGQESGSPPKAEYICADLSSRPNFPLQSCGGPYIRGTNILKVSALGFAGCTDLLWQRRTDFKSRSTKDSVATAVVSYLGD